MSGVRFTVQPGAGQQFTGAPLAQGATVWNVDLLNGVWISSDRNVSPGNGLLLPAQASCDWTGSQLFACLDTGNSAPVILQVSNDVQNVSNPVGIAEAIALIGIPTVLTTTLVAQSTVNNGSNSGLQAVGGYGSVIVVMSVPGFGNTLDVELEWIDVISGTNNIVDTQYVTVPPVTGGIATIILSLPVIAQSLVIANSSGALLDYTIIGSNRLVPGPRMLGPGNSTPPRRFAASAIPANTLTDLISQDLLPTYTVFNGKVFGSVFTTVAADIYMVFIDPSGVQRQAVVCHAVAATNTVFECGHPFSGVIWAVDPGALDASCILTLTSEVPE